MTKTKDVNYTPAMVAVMYDMYLAARDGNQEIRDAAVAEITDTFLAEPFEVVREKKSIISKLSRMTVAGTDTQLYIPKAKVSTVTGEPAKKKDALGIELAGLVNAVIPAELNGVTVARVNAENVAKLNKTDIQGMILFARMVEVKPVVVAETETENVEADES